MSTVRVLVAEDETLIRLDLVEMLVAMMWGMGPRSSAVWVRPLFEGGNHSISSRTSLP